MFLSPTASSTYVIEVSSHTVSRIYLLQLDRATGVSPPSLAKRRDIMEYVRLAIILLFVSASLGSVGHARPQSSSSAQEVKRGKYLVEEVAKCPECHTPRAKNNQLDPARWLPGAPISIHPVFNTTNWADLVPALAGLSNYTDEQATRVLEKGERANGDGTVQPPMHIYHMNHADAHAIIMYLRSLPNHR